MNHTNWKESLVVEGFSCSLSQIIVLYPLCTYTFLIFGENEILGMLLHIEGSVASNNEQEVVRKQVKINSVISK